MKSAARYKYVVRDCNTELSELGYTTKRVSNVHLDFIVLLAFLDLKNKSVKVSFRYEGR